ncbi:MAG TPA: thymidylate synthase [Victivallales bacterium]|nr:thymidylate synthase [Victivallales bacterium]
MEIIKGKNADELFINASNALIKRGHRRAPRGLETLELNDAWLVLENINECVVNLPERNLDLNYLHGELEWYKSGSLDVKDIEKYSKFWTKLADSNGTVNSNYGFLAFKEKFAGKSQVEWCVDKINEDKQTRQAIINYNQPRHKYEGNKDFVCTISQLFNINQDNKLESRTFMRSNDLIYGLTYDLPWFCYTQAEIANRTNNEVGQYKHYAASLHVYEKHFDMLEKIANHGQSLLFKPPIVSSGTFPEVSK